MAHRSRLTRLHDPERKLHGQPNDGNRNPRRCRRPRSCRHQDEAAGRLVLRRLRRCRHHAADRRRGPVRGARPACRPARCSTSPPATATPRSPPRGAGARSPPPTTCRRCSSAAARAPRPKAWRSSSARPTPRRCRSPTRQLRRGALDLRRDVHAGPGQGRRRAAARVQAAAARSGSPTGRRTALSASCSRRSASTCRRQPA